jgi:hypothetical protein
MGPIKVISLNPMLTIHDPMLASRREQLVVIVTYWALGVHCWYTCTAAVRRFVKSEVFIQGPP